MSPLLLAAALAGCTTTTIDPVSGREVKTSTSGTRTIPTPPPAPQPRPGAGTTVPPRPLDPSITDPSADRLHDIGGPLQLYLKVYRKMPAKLDDLASLVDLGTGPLSVSPTTGKPYVYVPAGLVAPSDKRKLIVYEAEPAPGTRRWGLLLGESQGDQPEPATWVVPLTDAMLKTFVPAAGLTPLEPAPGAATPR